VVLFADMACAESGIIDLDQLLQPKIEAEVLGRPRMSPTKVPVVNLVQAWTVCQAADVRIAMVWAGIAGLANPQIDAESALWASQVAGVSSGQDGTPRQESSR
jgi:hypothetical protein